MPRQPKQPDDEIPLEVNWEFLKWLSRFPALTVMVFLRRDLGYRELNLLALITMTGVLFALASYSNETSRPQDLMIFAAVMFLLGLAQRIRRWREYRRGVRQHSYYIGTSLFDFRWLPGFIRNERRIARYVDPAVCIIIGFASFPYTHALALWLMFAGVALRGYEDAVYKRELHQRLDTIDGLVVSEIQADTVERFSKEAAAPPPQQQRTGIPTGMGDDIQDRIKSRKPKRVPPIIPRENP
jgi:hypothetical protein